MKEGIGVIYIAFGANAVREVEASARTVPSFIPRYIRKDGQGACEAHRAKTQALKWSPYKLTLMLDADTRVRDWEALSIGFDLLRQGVEVVMAPSWPPQDGRTLWSLTSPDRDYTFQVMGKFQHVMLNTGVLFFSKTARTEKLFSLWEEEWERFKKWDQGAFLRALNRAPVIMSLLGRDFNSLEGSVVEHHFGKAR